MTANRVSVRNSISRSSQSISCSGSIDGNSERLYLEFGGKLVQDKHAMRVLPGFDENAKIKLLAEDEGSRSEIIICIYSGRYHDQQDPTGFRHYL